MDVVLDTSAYSHLRRGHPKVQDIVAKAATVLLPTIVLGELEAAFQLGSRTKENVATLEPWWPPLVITGIGLFALGRVTRRWIKEPIYVVEPDSTSDSPPPSKSTD